MSKKYKSMQEELAARRAVSENREVTAERSDLAASGHFERSGQKGPMSRPGQAGRSRLTNRPGSAHSSKLMSRLDSMKIPGSAGRARLMDRLDSIFSPEPASRPGSTSRPGSASRPGQANRPGSANRPRRRGPEKTGGSSLRRGTMAVIVVLVVVIAIASIIAGYIHIKEYQQDLTDMTEPTEFTWAPPSGDVEIDEWASLNDIYAFIDERTEPMEEPESLYGDVYWDIRDIIYRYQKDCNWYIHEGRIFVSPECDLDDDPETLAATWTEASDKIHKKLETADKENASVVIAIRSGEDWRLRMLLIDGGIEFVSEIWEP